MSLIYRFEEQKKRPHELKPQNQKQSYKLFFDVESQVIQTNEVTQTHKLKVGCVVDDDNNFNYFYTVEEFYNIIKEYLIYSTLYIYAHNIKRYDSLILDIYTNTPKYTNFRLVNLYDKGSYFSLFQIDAEKREQQIFFIDTLNYCSMSLDKIANVFKLQSKVFIDDWVNVSMEILMDRVKTDVIILKEFVTIFKNFLQENELLEDVGITNATMSIKIFLKNFLKDRIYIHNSKNATKLERESYFGGRTECFRIGEYENIFASDINSMYPFAMKNVKIPTRLQKTFKTTFENGLEIIEDIIKKENVCILARVKIKTKNNYYPKLHNNRLCFPTGIFEVVLCEPELKIAIKNNDIINVMQINLYDCKIGVFDEYIDYFYKIKEGTNPVWTFISKIFLNSLYGKFGQIISGYTNYCLIDDTSILKHETVVNDKKQREDYRIVGGLVQKHLKKKEETDAFNSFCAISSFITSFSRAMLLDYINIAGKENVFYCDTDSLYTNEKGVKNLENANFFGKEIGKLKLENVFKTITFNTAKDYSGITVEGETYTKLKGIRKNDVKIEENLYTSERWYSLSQFLKKGTEYKVEKFNKKVTRIYNKGNIDKNGVVTPFDLKG